jgi:hypothetical protein
MIATCYSDRNVGATGRSPYTQGGIDSEPYGCTMRIVYFAAASAAS